jgi:hypothetical protein
MTNQTEKAIERTESLGISGGKRESKEMHECYEALRAERKLKRTKLLNSLVGVDLTEEQKKAIDELAELI